MNSIWLEHSDYPGYRFSPEGSCLSLKTRDSKILKPVINQHGYCRWGLYGKHKGRYQSSHKIIAEIYCKKPETDELLEVNHIDGNKINNHFENLEWITKKENLKHSKIVLGNHHGQKKGINHTLSKLTESEVINIKKMLSNGFGQKEIAKKFKITRTCVSAIAIGKNWVHIGNNIKNTKRKKGHFKLNEKQVIEIKKLLKTKMFHKEIAEKFNVHKGTISAISTGTNWKHVTI